MIEIVFSCVSNSFFCIHSVYPPVMRAPAPHSRGRGRPGSVPYLASPITPLRAAKADRPRACLRRSRFHGGRGMGWSVAPPVFQGAGGPCRMVRRVLRHAAADGWAAVNVPPGVAPRQGPHLPLSMGEFKRPPSGTRWFCPERPHPDRTGCGYRIYGPGRSPRRCGSNIRPGPGSD